MPKRPWSQRVSRSEAASWRGRPITSASETPTCSIPIALSFRPTVWRQRQRSETSWWIAPSRSIRKCAQTPGRSPNSTSGAFAANVSNAELKLLDAV